MIPARTYARVMKERTTETQSTRRNESLRGFLRKSYLLQRSLPGLLQDLYQFAMKMHLIFIKRTALRCGKAKGERVTLVARHRLPFGRGLIL